MRVCPMILGVLFLAALETQSAERRFQSPELSLSEAIEAAQQENFKINAGRESVEAAESGIRVSRAQYLPTLNVVGSYSDYTGKVFISRFLNPPDPTGEADVGPYNSTMAAMVQLSQTIYSGGAIGARVAGNRVGHRIAQQEFLRMQLDLTYEVTKAYYDVLLSERSVVVEQEAVRRSEETLETINRRFREGESLQVDVLGARSQLAADGQALLEAQNNFRFAQRALNRLMGRDSEGEIQLTGTLEKADSAVDEAESVRLALERNPQIQKANLEIELAESMVRGARAHYKPKLGIDAYFSYLDNEMLFKGTYYGATINLSIPFAQDIAAGGGAVGQARARVRLQENTLREFRSAISLLAQQAVRRVQESQKASGVAEEYLSYHRERYRVTQTAYEEQLVTFNELLDSQTGLVEAELKLYQSFYQAQLAGAELRRITGADSGTLVGGGS